MIRLEPRLSLYVHVQGGGGDELMTDIWTNIIHNWYQEPPDMTDSWKNMFNTDKIYDI